MGIYTIDHDIHVSSWSPLSPSPFQVDENQSYIHVENISCGFYTSGSILFRAQLSQCCVTILATGKIVTCNCDPEPGGFGFLQSTSYLRLPFRIEAFSYLKNLPPPFFCLNFLLVGSYCSLSIQSQMKVR